MARACLGHCILTALLAFAAGLRAQPLPRQCLTREPPQDVRSAEHPDRALQGRCDPLIPRRSMAEWARTHGQTVPDHPVLFTDTDTNEAQVFPDAEAFLARHGHEEVSAHPEYSQSGSAFKSRQAACSRTFLEHEATWNESFFYYSDFDCADASLCHLSALEFGIPPLFRERNVISRNFLVGGPYSGLPFHKHGMTWQGLAMGRKAWYLLPPGSMSEAMHDITGPYIFPVRSWHAALHSVPLGRRPLYCEQHAGEVLFVPTAWWHATMNLDRCQVAYGEKPADLQQQSGTAELRRILDALPAQQWDSAGFTSDLAGGESGFERPMPYSVQARRMALSETCLAGLDDPSVGLEEPLRRMRLDTPAQMRCGLAEMAAYAHCNCAAWLLEAARGMADQCDFSEADAQAVLERAASWRRSAAALSPALARRETEKCGAQDPAVAL